MSQNLSKIHVTVVTLFPQLFVPFQDMTLIKKFFDGSGAELNVLYLGDCSEKSFKGCDSPPYGGGAGMILRADVLKVALEKIFLQHFPTESFDESFAKKFNVIFTAPRGKLWTNKTAREFSETHLNQSHESFLHKHHIFICGRYEGVDERFIQRYIDEIFSIGDYVLMGGELAVQIILESSLRFVPGVLGQSHSAEFDSFEDGALEYPQFTRPVVFEGIKVPDVLTSGDHAKISEFREKSAFEMTLRHRPDLVKKGHHD